MAARCGTVDSCIQFLRAGAHVNELEIAGAARGTDECPLRHARSFSPITAQDTPPPRQYPCFLRRRVERMEHLRDARPRDAAASLLSGSPHGPPLALGLVLIGAVCVRRGGRSAAVVDELDGKLDRRRAAFAELTAADVVARELT